jgi:hypothetical protein
VAVSNPHAPKWWVNRKSKLGSSPIAKEPPSSPGKPWYTTPPSDLPDLRHVEYAVQFKAELITRVQAGGPDATAAIALLAYVSPWIKKARRLLHYHQENIAEFDTTEGMLIALERVVSVLCAEATRRGFVIPRDDQRVIDALQAKANRLARERAQRFGRRHAS